MKNNNSEENKESIVEVSTKPNHLGVILVAAFAVLVMYGIIYAIYNQMDKDDNEKAAQAAAKAAKMTTTEFIETTEVTTELYNHEYLDVPDADRISAKSAILYNMTTNTILFEKNPDMQCYPASTTKLITAIVALQNVSPDTIYTVGTEIKLIGEDSSSAYLVEGSQLSLESLIYAMLLPSGNDAAYTVAVNTARIVSGNPEMTDEQSVAYFCGLMNGLASELEMENTHFADPDGWYMPNHYVTAEDMLKIAIKSMEFPIIINASSTMAYTVTPENGSPVYTWENNNKFINEMSDFYYPYATGLKTGFTDEAGYCYVASAEKDGTELIALIFGSATMEDRYRDAKNIFNAIFEPEAIEYAEVTAPPEEAAQDMAVQ